MMIIAAGGIEEFLFTIVDALRVPVLLAVLIALLITLFDLGAFFMELARRRRREAPDELKIASKTARRALEQGDVPGAAQALLPSASSAEMAAALTQLVEQRDAADASDRLAKGSPTSTSARCGGSSARGIWSAPARLSA